MDTLTCSIKDNIALLDFALRPDLSFDLVKRDLQIAGRQAALYFVDGFIKDEVFEKILEFFFKITPDEIAAIPNMQVFAVTKMPYVEADFFPEMDDLQFKAELKRREERRKRGEERKERKKEGEKKRRRGRGKERNKRRVHQSVSK